MEYVSSKVEFNFAWDQIATAWWVQYPNDQNPHVLCTDILEANVKDGKLFVRRLFKKSNDVPSWVEKLAPSVGFTGVVEECLVDPLKKVMVTYVRNITNTTFMKVEEKSTYTVNPSNKNITDCLREAWFQSGLFGPLASALKKIGKTQYKENLEKAEKGFRGVLEKMYPNTEPEEKSKIVDGNESEQMEELIGAMANI